MKYMLLAMSALLACLALAKSSSMSYENTFYVIFSASTYYQNYRHSLDAFLFYRELKDRGISDDHILLLVSKDHACDPRNPYTGKMHAYKDYDVNIVCEDVEIDFKAEDLKASYFVDALRDRFDEGFPRTKRL